MSEHEENHLDEEEASQDDRRRTYDERSTNMSSSAGPEDDNPSLHITSLSFEVNIDFQISELIISKDFF